MALSGSFVRYLIVDGNQDKTIWLSFDGLIRSKQQKTYTKDGFVDYRITLRFDDGRRLRFRGALGLALYEIAESENRRGLWPVLGPFRPNGDAYQEHELDRDSFELVTPAARASVTTLPKPVEQC